MHHVIKVQVMYLVPVRGICLIYVEQLDEIHSSVSWYLLDH